MRRLTLIPILLLASCVFSTEPDFEDVHLRNLSIDGDLVLSARSEYQRDTLRVVLHIENHGSTPGTIGIPYCSTIVRGVGVRGRDWDNRPPPDATCPDALFVMPIEAGQSRDRTVWQTVRHAGWMPPSGWFAITLYYRLKDSEGLKSLRAGAVVID